MNELVVEIEFKSVCNIGYCAENYVQKINGTILGRNEGQGDVVIGDVELLYVDVSSAINDKIPLLSFFDYEEITEEYCFSLYNCKKIKWDKKVLDMFDDNLIGENILILHRIRVFPKFRKKKIGLLVLRRCIQQFSHDCGVVALIAKPYQMELGTNANENEEKLFEEYQLSEFESNEKKACQKLEAYYKSLGFWKLKNTGLMVMNPSETIPTMEELGADEFSFFCF